MIIDELFEAPQQCPECGGISFSDLILAEKKDACYHKVKASAKVWPSAYASGRLVQCRKKGAANYGNKSEGVAEGSLNESAVFLNPTTVVVGQAHGQPLELSPDTLKKIQDIAAKHGAWYEGNGTDRSYTKGQIDRYVGSWDDEVAKSASPNDPKWLYVLFANVDENNRVQRVGVDPKDTIFNRLLAGAQDNSFQGIGYTAQALQKFLQMASEGKYDFVKMSQQPATQENLTRFLKAGEALMWPSNWEQYPNRAGKIAKAATVDVRDQYLATRKAGVYVTGSGHLKAVQNITGQQGVAENAGQPLSVQQLATISDAALDQAYGYGRSTPGNTFGWQANLKSAAYAKQMIDQGVTDIEAISDAIHKGWNTTAQAFVQNPDQFDDTAKLAAAGKLQAKLQQRAQLMKQNYGQLPEEEKEKDRVVARALLQAIRGTQQPGMAEGYVPINIYKGPTIPASEPKKVKKDYTPKYDPQVHGPVYDLEWQRQQNEKRWYNVVRKSDGKVLNPEPIKGQTAAEEFRKQNGLGGGNADLVQVSTLRFHATGIDASGKRVVSEPLLSMKDVRNFYKQHGINQFASTTDVTTTDDGSVAEGQLELNTPDPVVVVQDLKGNILDKINLSVAAQKYKLGQPQNIKNQLAHQNYTKVGNYTIVSPMSGQPQDQTTIGQKSTFATTEGEQQKGADYRDPKEVDYDGEYDAMVARVKKLAGLGPMKTTYDPAKRQYRNMPTAQQPKK